MNNEIFLSLLNWLYIIKIKLKCFLLNRTFSKKKITFLVRKFKKNCVWLFTLYAFIISKVIIRTQNYTNASLISAPVVISYQNV